MGLAHADNAGDALPGGIALTFESAEVGGGDGERAVIEELADGLDRLADVAAELGGGVAQDMDAGRRETGQTEVAPEAVVEGGAGDAGGQRPPARGTRWAAWRRGPCRHRREIAYGRERGRRKLTTTAHTALAEVAIEGGGVIEGDIAGCEVDDLRSASAG